MKQSVNCIHFESNKILTEQTVHNSEWHIMHNLLLDSTVSHQQFD